MRNRGRISTIKRGRQQHWACTILFVGAVGLLSTTIMVTFASGGMLDAKPANTIDLSKESGDGEGLVIDQKNWTSPQSSFKWVAIARGYEVPWDSVGRTGWLTDDAYVSPVDPGVSEFSSDTEAIYIVFAISALDAPSQFRAAWYHLPDGKTRSNKPDGTDALFLEMNEKSGYLEIYQPEGGWEKGKYLVRLFFESPGQELYDPNVVGIMAFTIID